MFARSDQYLEQDGKGLYCGNGITTHMSYKGSVLQSRCIGYPLHILHVFRLSKDIARAASGCKWHIQPTCDPNCNLQLARVCHELGLATRLGAQPHSRRTFSGQAAVLHE